MTDIWNLDEGKDYNEEKRKQFYTDNGLLNDAHTKYKIGQVIQFWTGYNGDIRAQAKIKGVKDKDLYVYNDCYWFPIQDDEQRQIEVIE